MRPSNTCDPGKCPPPTPKQYPPSKRSPNTRERTTKETNLQPHHQGSTQPLSTTSPAPTDPHTHRTGDPLKRTRQPAHPLTPDKGQNTSRRPKESAPPEAQPPWPTPQPVPRVRAPAKTTIAPQSWRQVGRGRYCRSGPFASCFSSSSYQPRTRED